MKASVKLRDQEGPLQKPIIKAKLPFELLGFPVHAGFKVCGHIQELALHLGTGHEAGPSLELSYRPNEQDHPFTLAIKTGFNPWSSSATSALTMAAEFNLLRPANPSFLLRVKPEVGDFSFRHDFRSVIRRGSHGGRMQSEADQALMERHGDGSSSDRGFTNTFARYASRPHAPDDASFPRRDAKQNYRYHAPATASFASYDSTPNASENAAFARFDTIDDGSENTRTPALELFPRDSYRYSSIDADWEPLGDTMNSRNPICSHRIPRMDRDWECVGDTMSRSTTSASSLSQQERDAEHIHVRRRPQCDNTSAGWGVHGFLGDSHLRACTRLPISTEAHFKMRWSVSACGSSSRVPFCPLLLLDKVSLEAVAPCKSVHKTSFLPPFSKSFRNDSQREDTAHLKQAEICPLKKAREKKRSENGLDQAGLDSELMPISELQGGDVDAKHSSFLGQFLHGKGLMD